MGCQGSTEQAKSGKKKKKMIEPVERKTKRGSVKQSDRQKSMVGANPYDLEKTTAGTFEISDEYWNVFDSPCNKNVDFMIKKTVAIGVMAEGYALVKRGVPEKQKTEWNFRINSDGEQQIALGLFKLTEEVESSEESSEEDSDDSGGYEGGQQREVINSWLWRLDTGNKTLNEEEEQEYTKYEVNKGDEIKMEVSNNSLIFYLNQQKVGLAFEDKEIRTGEVYPCVKFFSKTLCEVQLLGSN